MVALYEVTKFPQTACLTTRSSGGNFCSQSICLHASNANDDNFGNQRFLETIEMLQKNLKDQAD